MTLSAAANLACAAFYAILATGIVMTDFSGMALPMLLLAIPLAIFLADLFSGMVHVFLDYYPINREAGFYEMLAYQGDRAQPDYLALRKRVLAHHTTTLIDRLAYDFKIHHIKPRAMNRKTYAIHMLETVVPATLLALAALLVPAEGALTLFVMAFLVAHVQFVHACVHDTPRSVFWKRLVHLLQKLHVVYSLESHMQHHRHGVSNFCLITGWANVVLNPVFRLLVKLRVVDPANWVSLSTLRMPAGKPADY